MNQSILFPDDHYWNATLQQVEFPAQCMGALIICVVPLDVLLEMTGQDSAGEESALEQFEQYRFDFEELAESLIEDEVFNEKGQVVISSTI